MPGPEYRLRGRFAARDRFKLPDELASRLTMEPTPIPQWPRWYSLAAFLFMSMTTVFAMCTMGRPGA